MCIARTSRAPCTTLAGTGLPSREVAWRWNLYPWGPLSLDWKCRPAPSDPLCARTHRQAPRRIHFDHATQQALAVRRDEVRHVEHSPLHLLQQLPQVVIVEGQRPLPAGDGVTVGRGTGREGRHRGAAQRWKGEGRAGRRGGGAGRSRVWTAGSPPAARTGSLRSSTRPPCARRTFLPARAVWLASWRKRGPGGGSGVREGGGEVPWTGRDRGAW